MAVARSRYLRDRPSLVRHDRLARHRPRNPTGGRIMAEHYAEEALALAALQKQAGRKRRCGYRI